jgi:hypothetical protein
MRKLTLIATIIMLITAVAYGQTSLPIDFEGGAASVTLTDFDGGNSQIIANPDASGENTTSFVVEHVRDGGQVWAGTKIELSSAIDFTTNNTFNIKVWSPNADIPLLFKLENGDGSVFNQISDTIRTASEWVEMSYNFDGQPSGTYTYIVLIFNLETLGDGTANSTYYFDEIEFVPGATDPEPTVGAPDPTQDPGDVISLFSGVYTDVTVDTWRTDWSSATYEEVTIDGNPTKKYSNLDVVGIETGTSTIDASGMTHVHLDVWSPDFTQFSIKIVDFGTDGAYGGGDDTEHQVNIASSNQEEWVGIDIPLSDFTGLTAREHLAQYILVGQPTGATTVYVDNFYFYEEAAATTYTITFNVTDGTNPLEGATVDINSTALTTDINGDATIDLEDGDYPYTVSFAGYVDSVGSVTVSGAAQTINIALEEVTIAEPTVGAPVPTQDPADVISLFSDTYTDVTVDTWRTDWSSAVYEEVTIDGNPAKKYSDLDVVGIESGTSTVDATGMTHVHLDVWSPNFTQFSIKIVDFGADGSYDGGDDTEHQINIATPAQEEWVSLDIPFTDFTGLASREHLAQYILVGQPTGTTIVYIDNFYFYNTAVGPTYTVTFNVTDGTDPLEGASVAINGSTLTTDASGVATVDLADGNYPYTVSLSGYADSVGSVTVSGAALAVDIALEELNIPAPTVAAPIPPVRDPGDVISIFSDAYTNLGGTNFDPFWGQTTDVSIDSIGDNGMLSYISFNYQGTELAGPNNMSAMEYLHIDMWTEDATVVKVSPISSGTGEYLTELTPITAGEWVSYDIPLSTFTDNGVSMNDIFQMKFDGQAGVTPSNIYIDNMYFWREAGSTTSTVTFNVTDGTDPIQAAVVTVNSQNYATNAAGVAEVFMEDGTYAYTVTASGYADGSGSITVAGSDITEDVTLISNPVPTVAAPEPPVRDPEDVISIFSGAYANLTGTNFNPGWGQTTLMTFEEIESDSVMKYRNFNYQGIELSGSIDATEMDYLHVDIWTYDATVVKVSPISGGGEYLVELTPLTTESWVSFNIPLSEFSNNGVTLNDIIQMKFDGQAGVVPSVVYVDNVYFYKSTSQEYTVTFNVTDGTDPIAGASIAINSTTLTTDASGMATIDLPDGPYGYTVTATNFETASGNVVVDGADITENVTMDPVGIGNIAQNIANVYPNPVSDVM